MEPFQTSEPDANGLPQLLTAKQAANWGQWPEKQSYELEGKLPAGCVVRFGRRIRFRADLLLLYIESQRSLTGTTP